MERMGIGRAPAWSVFDVALTRPLGACVGIALAVLLLAGCSGDEIPVDSSNYPKHGPKEDTHAQGSVLGGDGGIVLFGGKKSGANDEGGAGGGGIGVNAYLWRASLDTLGFMPLASADPFGGVIITDWYSPPETPDERFKVNLYILDRQLRADGVKAAVFRQRRTPEGVWADAAVDHSTVTDLENAILTRARQIRVNTAQR
jgi:hypothetical protein